MHSYLGAIGFSQVNKKQDLDMILEDVLKNCDEKRVVENEDGRLFVEISKSYGYDCGITLCGEYDDQDEFHMEYYYPYFRGTGVSTN